MINLNKRVCIQVIFNNINNIEDIYGIGSHSVVVLYVLKNKDNFDSYEVIYMDNISSI